MTLLESTVAEYMEAVDSFLSKHHIILEKHQFDMLVSFTYNYGSNWWTRVPEKVMPRFIREGNGVYNPAMVMEIFEMHENIDRRREETKIFSNGY